MERRAAGERHLTVPERCLAVPEEPGSPSTAVCAPRQPRGLPAAELSAPGGAAGSRAPASLEQLQSGREHCAWRDSPRATEAASSAGPLTPSAPARLLLKPGGSECALLKPSVAPALSLEACSSAPRSQGQRVLSVEPHPGH